MKSDNNTIRLKRDTDYFDKNRNGKALIFLETKAQVRDCLHWIDNSMECEAVIVALSPFAMYELDKHEIQYKIPEEYYKSHDLYALGVANFNKIEDLCEIIDGIIMESCPSAKKRGITPALFSFYHLKVMYDAMIIRIFQISSILKIEKPDIVYIYNTEKYPFGSSETAPFIRFDNSESIYSQLMALDGWKVQVKIMRSEVMCDNKSPKMITNFNLAKFKTFILLILSHHPKLFDLVILIKKKGFSNLFTWFWYNRKLSKKHETIALLGGGYNWDECIIQLKAKQISPIYRIRYDFHELITHVNKNENLDVAWVKLLNNQDFSKFFTFSGITFFPVIESRLQFLVEQITINCIRIAQDTEKIIVDMDIKAFISSVISNCFEHSVAKVAHNNGIPVITWQHGAYGAMYHPIIDYLDLISSDFHFVFGEGVAEQYALSAKKFKTELISIGSSTLGEMMECSKEDSIIDTKKTILYITSGGYHNNLYISCYPPFSDNLLWQTQKAIIDIFEKYNEYSVIIKLHPGTIFKDIDLGAYADTKKLDEIKVIKNEKTVVDLLPLADIIIIDLPSTTLLQAITTNKPVFVYMGHLFFDAKAYQLLDKRAIINNKLEDFISDLNDYLCGGNYSKDVLNTEFLEMFGIASEKESSTNRATQMLRKIIDASNT